MDARGTTASEVTIQNGRFTVGRAQPRPAPQPLHARRSISRPHGRARASSTTTTTSSCSASGRATTRRSKARLDRRRAGRPHGARQGRAGGRVHHLDGRLEPGAVRREAAADAGRARRRAAEPPGAGVPGVHRPGGHQHARQGVLHLEGRRGQRRRRDRGQRAVDGGAQRAARRADLRRPEARHRRRAWPTRRASA